MKQNRSEFVELLYSTGREGMDEVIGQLEELGFFQAPASSKFHLNHEGGLLEHSLNVCKVGLMLREQMLALKPDLEESLNKESVIIAALLHDICKADIYQKCIRKRKDRLGQWVDYETYELDYSDFPLGHGEKSVIVLLRMGLDLSDDEIMAIRWHMSAWDLPFQSPDLKANFDTAKRLCPLCSLIQAADGLASNLLESKDPEETY
ncbi:HD domain-containing protein [Phocaeicola barnesiae]|uniref:HD domain-containing protein n=2 Tax=Phocaeicola barnesiae TaxID=376804 RepID=A0AAW5N2B4_9BACT|nr:HD domain-containing protein [Phocaeicola barnesiae]MCR8874512.1 HD domain-containing protein [Phocaeicola barnesiae]MDM8308947.1 HD domain-containing protein [Phocaeicola barnesiae]